MILSLHINSKATQSALGVSKYQIMGGIIEVCAIRQARYVRRILSAMNLKIGKRLNKDTVRLVEK